MTTDTSDTSERGLERPICTSLTGLACDLKQGRLFVIGTEATLLA